MAKLLFFVTISAFITLFSIPQSSEDCSNEFLLLFLYNAESQSIV